MSITVRTFDDDLTKVPRHWLSNDAVATAISNGVSMLFPWGERFFVRSVKHFAGQIDDPVLKGQIKAFFGQEGRHAKAHDDFNGVLRAQGYEVDQFLDTYARLSAWIEAKCPPKLRLAATAAAEHFTAILAHGAFTGPVFEEADPRMQRLMAWHAAEEIEHKAVAFDVLRAVDPSYALRITGLVMATMLLGGFWIAATTVLLRQDGISWRQALRKLNALRGRDPIVRRVFLRGIRQYIRPGFHPSDIRDERLAADWMAAHGMELPEAA
jgi:predicted metal-dependent hydrolase